MASMSMKFGIRYDDGTFQEVDLGRPRVLVNLERQGIKLDDLDMETLSRQLELVWKALACPAGDFDAWLDTVAELVVPDVPEAAAVEADPKAGAS